MKKTIKCPSCGKIQKTIIEWKSCSVATKINLETGDCDELDMEKGDFESFSCENCHEDLPVSINPKIMAILGY